MLGTRAAALAPVADLGLVVVWDDGDDLHAEPRTPYPHVRDVLVQRAHLAGAAALVGGHARTAEAQVLLDTGWARALDAPRAVVRAVAPRVDGTSDDDLARDPLARAARLPALSFAAAREALAAGAPVLVQVPRRGYVPSLLCARDRTPARCAACAGPLATGGRGAVAGLPLVRGARGRLACPVCGGTALRAGVVGARRTAEELGRAFPGTVVRTSGGGEVLAAVPGRAVARRLHAGGRAGGRGRVRRGAPARRLGRCCRGRTCGRARRRCGAGSRRPRWPGRRRRAGGSWSSATAGSPRCRR